MQQVVGAAVQQSGAALRFAAPAKRNEVGLVRRAVTTTPRQQSRQKPLQRSSKIYQTKHSAEATSRILWITFWLNQRNPGGHASNSTTGYLRFRHCLDSRFPTLSGLAVLLQKRHFP